MKIYQIYVPELAAYAKFKVFEPDQIEDFINSYKKEHKEADIVSFKKKVLDTFVFNLKSDIIDSLRMMSRKSAESCTDALFNGCIMLNPGLDIDLWLSIAYTAEVDPFDDIAGEDLASEFMKSIKKMSDRPKIDMDDFPFDAKHKPKPKIKPITKQKYLGLENHLKSNIIRTRSSNRGSCISP
jgi:hypothetical protein